MAAWTLNWGKAASRIWNLHVCSNNFEQRRDWHRRLGRWYWKKTATGACGKTGHRESRHGGSACSSKGELINRLIPLTQELNNIYLSIRDCNLNRQTIYDSPAANAFTASPFGNNLW